MANINDVYGNNFQQKATLDKALHASGIFAQNIAHKQFNFRNKSPDMWNGNNMKPDVITAMIGQVKTGNPAMELVHIPKTSHMINAFPYLVNGPVEYFLAVDTKSAGKPQVYSLYITPNCMCAY
jgi:hypothetical protein